MWSSVVSVLLGIRPEYAPERGLRQRNGQWRQRAEDRWVNGWPAGVRFIARGAHLLPSMVRGAKDDFQVHGPATDDPAGAGPCDFALLCVKTSGTAAGVAAVSRLLAPAGQIPWSSRPASAAVGWASRPPGGRAGQAMPGAGRKENDDRR